MSIPIKHEHTSDGYAAFTGEYKVACLTTKHYKGLQKDGVPIMEAMPREAWTIHFTSPSMSLELVGAILASVPKEA